MRDALLPLDVARFASEAAPPSLISPAGDAGGTTADYLHAPLCRATLNACSTEDEAKVMAMSAAQDQIGRQLATLETRQRQIRAEDITVETPELIAGAGATRR